MIMASATLTRKPTRKRRHPRISRSRHKRPGRLGSCSSHLPRGTLRRPSSRPRLASAGASIDGLRPPQRRSPSDPDCAPEFIASRQRARRLAGQVLDLALVRQLFPAWLSKRRDQVRVDHSPDLSTRTCPAGDRAPPAATGLLTSASDRPTLVGSSLGAARRSKASARPRSRKGGDMPPHKLAAMTAAALVRASA